MSTFLDDIIPTTSIPAAIDAARSIVIVKDFKIGGSAISSWLSENRSALWLDYEDGSEALPGVKINVIAKAKQMGMKRIDFLLKLWADLAADSQSGTPRFNYLIHDKINQLEDWAELWATAYYKQTIPGKNFKGNSVLELPEGGGYRFLREKFLDLWNAASVAAPRSIWWCSQKLKYIGDGNNKFEVSRISIWSANADPSPQAAATPPPSCIVRRTAATGSASSPVIAGHSAAVAFPASKASDSRSAGKMQTVNSSWTGTRSTPTANNSQLKLNNYIIACSP
jgi:hypothetical protein